MSELRGRALRSVLAAARLPGDPPNVPLLGRPVRLGMMFYRASVEIEKRVPREIEGLSPTRSGVTLFGASRRNNRRTNDELLKIDEQGPPGARLALDALAIPEGAAEWSVWGPATGQPRSKALDIKELILKQADLSERRAILKQAEADEVVEVKLGHPWSTMIRQGTMGMGPPWMWIPGDQMMSLFRKHTQTLGEHAALIGRTPVRLGGRVANIPTRLYPLVPTWLEIPNDNPEIFRLKTGFGADEDLDPDDVHWYRQPGMSNPYDRGVGVMHALAEDLELDESQAKYLNAILNSIGQLRSALVVPGIAGTTQEDKLRLELERTRGAARAARLSLLLPEDPEAAKAIQHLKLGESPADLQTYESRAENRDTFLRGNRVSPGAVGVARDVNRANAHIAREDLRSVHIYNLESMRRFHQQRYFEPRGDQPAEYAGEDRLFCMWKLDPLRDAETARLLVRSVPEFFTERQVLELAGFEGGDPNRKIQRNVVTVSDSST